MTASEPRRSEAPRCNPRYSGGDDGRPCSAIRRYGRCATHGEIDRAVIPARAYTFRVLVRFGYDPRRKRPFFLTVERQR